MHAYAQAGVDHVMFLLVPYNRESIDRLEGSLQLYRQISGENKPLYAS